MRLTSAFHLLRSWLLCVAQQAGWSRGGCSFRSNAAAERPRGRIPGLTCASIFSVSEAPLCRGVLMCHCCSLTIVTDHAPHTGLLCAIASVAPRETRPPWAGMPWGGTAYRSLQVGWRNRICPAPGSACAIHMPGLVGDGHNWARACRWLAGASSLRHILWHLMIAHRDSGNCCGRGISTIV